MATHFSNCLETSMNGGAWWATIHGVAKSQTQLSMHEWNNLKYDKKVMAQSLATLQKENVYSGITELSLGIPFDPRNQETDRKWKKHLGTHCCDGSVCTKWHEDFNFFFIIYLFLVSIAVHRLCSIALSLLMKVKEESEKAGLKPNIQKTKIMASGPITSWQ